MGDSEISSYTLQKVLRTPQHISSLAFGHGGHLYAGSDDGSLRVYDLSTFKVIKAIRGLGNEISSIVCIKRPGSELRDAWIACGRYIMNFQLDSPKMIQTLDDALKTVEIESDEEDVLNELATNINKSHVAFSMDSGTVGVVDLSTSVVTKMQIKHTSVCGSVKFISDRPREIVSGGYDTALLHFDFVEGTLLTRKEMEPNISEEGISLAPSFILSTALSPSGVFAAGTADGRLWIGFGGEKALEKKGKKKKGKQWKGLNSEESLLIKVAEGPIVGLAFSSARILITSTLLGVLTIYRLDYDVQGGSVILKQLWREESTDIEKVNAVIIEDKRFVVGGFSKTGEGIIEIWRQTLTPQPSISEPRPDL